MQRLVLVSAVALQLTSFAAAQATPLTPPSASTGNPAIVRVQGWWEQERAGDRARQAYWRLPPPAMDRYNRLQARINDLNAQRDQIDRQVRHAVREQQELLGFGPR